MLGLREVAANLLQDNIPVDNHQKAKLKRSRVFCRELASKGVTRKLVENSRTIAFLPLPDQCFYNYDFCKKDGSCSIQRTRECGK